MGGMIKCNLFLENGDETRRSIGAASYPVVPERGDDLVFGGVVYTVEGRCLFENTVNVVVKAPDRKWQIIGGAN